MCCHRDQKDIGLLHMASVLQRLGLLDDATTVMEVAITFNSANLLYHYILAGIYVVCIYIHTYIHMYICMCVCMYLCTVCTVLKPGSYTHRGSTIRWIVHQNELIRLLGPCKCQALIFINVKVYHTLRKIS